MMHDALEPAEHVSCLQVHLEAAYAFTDDLTLFARAGAGTGAGASGW
jgi:hypothetical protein